MNDPVSVRLARGVRHGVLDVWHTAARVVRYRRFTLPDRWHGVLAPLGIRADDGRVLAFPAGAVRMADPALLVCRTPDAFGVTGHAGAVRTVRIDHGDLIGEGTLDLSTRSGRRVARRLAGTGGLPIGIEVDDTTNHFAESTGTWTFLEWRLRGATLGVAVAFPRARITPVWTGRDSRDPQGPQGSRGVSGRALRVM